MTASEHVCTTCAHQSSATETSRTDLTRRKALTAFGAILGAIGLASASEAANAAAKTYVACKTSKVPVRGAFLAQVAGRSILITQPKKGVFRAFDPTCTHAGCQLSGMSGTNLVCNCHGATFNTDTGAATGGPARTPLTKIKVAVSGGSVRVTL